MKAWGLLGALFIQLSTVQAEVMVSDLPPAQPVELLVDFDTSPLCAVPIQQGSNAVYLAPPVRVSTPENVQTAVPPATVQSKSGANFFILVLFAIVFWMLVRKPLLDILILALNLGSWIADRGNGLARKKS